MSVRVCIWVRLSYFRLWWNDGRLTFKGKKDGGCEDKLVFLIDGDHVSVCHTDMVAVNKKHQVICATHCLCVAPATCVLSLCVSQVSMCLARMGGLSLLYAWMYA